MLILSICTCGSSLSVISFVFHYKHCTGTDIPIWHRHFIQTDGGTVRGHRASTRQSSKENQYVLMLRSVLLHRTVSSLCGISNSTEDQNLKNVWVFEAWNINKSIILLEEVLQKTKMPDSYTFQSGALKVCKLVTAAVAHKDWGWGYLVTHWEWGWKGLVDQVNSLGAWWWWEVTLSFP